MRVRLAKRSDPAAGLPGRVGFLNLVCKTAIGGCHEFKQPPRQKAWELFTQYNQSKSLNYKIAMLPHELMDYVLIHELVHVKHCNHSKQFWEELHRLVGDANAMDRKLNEYSALLLQPDL